MHGIDMFKYPELRKVFCPTREAYFIGSMLPLASLGGPRQRSGCGARPQDHVFTGFDQILDYGKVLGLQMSKVSWFDGATFIQVSLKSLERVGQEVLGGLRGGSHETTSGWFHAKNRMTVGLNQAEQAGYQVYECS
jgi:hypothetical protein